MGWLVRPREAGERSAREGSGEFPGEISTFTISMGVLRPVSFGLRSSPTSPREPLRRVCVGMMPPPEQRHAAPHRARHATDRSWKESSLLMMQDGDSESIGQGSIDYPGKSMSREEVHVLGRWPWLGSDVR
eukprot:5295955-Amphidinium_carterae.1